MDHNPDASGIGIYGHYYKVSRLETGIVHFNKTAWNGFVQIGPYISKHRKPNPQPLILYDI